MNKLKPCQCGGVAKMQNHNLMLRGAHYVECTECLYQTGIYFDEIRVIKYWNHRPIEDALTARIEELENLIKKNTFVTTQENKQ